MNERTQELAAEAFQVFNKLDENYAEMFEKFAELLVNDIASKIGDEYAKALDEVMDDWDRGFLGGLSCAVDTVQNQFGVAK